MSFIGTAFYDFMTVKRKKWQKKSQKSEKAIITSPSQSEKYIKSQKIG
jgi:hypothetical protein